MVSPQFIPTDIQMERIRPTAVIPSASISSPPPNYIQNSKHIRVIKHQLSICEPNQTKAKPKNRNAHDDDGKLGKTTTTTKEMREKLESHLRHRKTIKVENVSVFAGCWLRLSVSLMMCALERPTEPFSCGEFLQGNFLFPINSIQFLEMMSNVI